MSDILFLVSTETVEKVNKIIAKYFKIQTKSYTYYIEHVKSVTKKAFEIAESKFVENINYDKLYLSAMLHDIGIVKTYAPDIGCYGTLPYLAHANIGRHILEDEGLYEIASVCENHVGVGITKEEIIRNNLPLEPKDMYPQNIEEKIVCLADKFFSKSAGQLSHEQSLKVIRAKMKKLGDGKLIHFNELLRELTGID